MAQRIHRPAATHGTGPSPEPNAAPGIVTLIHYWLPLALGWSLALVMRHATGASFSSAGMVLLLGGIGAAYSFDRLVDRPADAPRPPWLQRSLVAATFLFAAATLIAASRMPPRVLEVAVLLSATSLLYPFIKRLPLVKTAAVALAWTWASAALPLDPSERLAWTWWSLDVSLPVILLLSAGCILCDLKDARHDREGDVPSLPVLFGIRATCRIATLLALVAGGFALANGREALLVTGLALAAAAQFPALIARDAVGPIVVDSVLILPGILIAAGLV